MHARLLSLCLLLSLTAALFVVPGATAAPVGTNGLSTSEHQENIAVQSCAGFDVLATYTATRDYRIVTDPGGGLVHERRHVRFAGTVANGETGTALSFDGEFTRIADYDAGHVSKHGYILWDGVPGEGVTLVTIDRRLGELPDDLPALLAAVAPRHLGGNLCSILDDSRSDIDDASDTQSTGQCARLRVCVLP